VRGWLCFVVLLGCGDNVDPSGPPLQHADTLFLAAHPDDDMIFMEPELQAALARNAATTTIYATTSGPRGPEHHLFEAAKVAYGAAAGSEDWACGEIAIGTIQAKHCRLRDRPVSLVDLGLPDGGIPGDKLNSLLHLVDGTVTALPGYYGGGITQNTVVDVFTALLVATTPTSVQTLELAGSHGRDHSSHMFVGTIGLWAAARIGYAGPLMWNRGYNVGEHESTLAGDELAQARTLLGYFEACAYACGPCGASCSSLTESHEMWIARQYSVERSLSATGKLALAEQCLDASLQLGDCASGATFALEPTGALRTGDRCVTSGSTGELALALCDASPEQYWVLDSEGSLWNGRPVERSADMAYDHVRCLTDGGARTCGATMQAHWRIMP
jgi:hypothetical protein